MKIYSTYSVKIKHYNHIFKDTVTVYRNAVDFLIDVCINEWDDIVKIQGSNSRQRYIETLIHKSKKYPEPKYDFDIHFYKMPSYLRRAAISEAIGKVSSYKSNYLYWEENRNGRAPGIPKAGYIYPSLYKDNMYEETGTYTAKIKVYIRNTWDWISVDLRKSDIDYINRHCSTRKKCVPVLRKRGKEWFLDFPFEEDTKLYTVPVNEKTLIAVDLGINCAATISVMKSDGTILGRHFCHLDKELDHLSHSTNRIKKAQQHGNRKTPRLWAKAKGINHDISCKTANFIMDVAVLYNADVIVFEHLEKKGKVRGSKKQKLKLWRSQEVQAMVVDKAHRLGKHVCHINAWGTSRLAYDGSGYVTRGIDSNYSICQFTNGKVYNCDLSASYNIGARYFIREILKSLDESSGLQVQAEVPELSKRSTCTFSTLISLNAALSFKKKMAQLSLNRIVEMQSARLKQAGVA
ncbi:MAG: transposase [Erysipelotrichaceae bacterium]|nr:transposase [Erysipelotrichaceae bacterium]